MHGLLDARSERAEIEIDEELAHRREIDGFLPGFFRQPEIDRRVAADRRQHLREQRLFLPRLQQLDHARLDAGRGESLLVFLQLLEKAFQRSEIHNEIRRRLLADAADARDVVGRIAAQALVVRQQFRPEAEALAHAVLVIYYSVFYSLLQRIDAHLFSGNELQGIHVAGSDDDVDRRIVLRLLDDGAEHVVRLESRERVERYGKRRDEILRPDDLRDESLVDLLAGPFVFLICLMAVRRRRKIVRRDDVVRLDVRHYFQNHRGKSVQRARRLAGLGNEIRQRMVRAVDDRVRVEQDQGLLVRRFRRLPGFFGILRHDFLKARRRRKRSRARIRRRT